MPFGFATEYLPVVLREQKYSYAAIAALFWLQLPWQLKILWSKVADLPRMRRHSRRVILMLQLLLSGVVAAFALRRFEEAPILWFVLTAMAAALAATQDVFVDALAVRTLLPEERGLGNTAQVAGYRVGMLVGGAALLLLVGRFGEKTTLLGCSTLVAGASIGAFVSGDEAGAGAGEPDSKGRPATPSTKAHDTIGLVRHALGKNTWHVLALALTFKIGLHMAGSLLKPMAVDYGWTREQIGGAVVTVGSISALVGSGLGGVLHRVLGERRALAIALCVQAAVCAPLIAVEMKHAPLGLTTVAIAVEHFGSGLGTTVLFAALMTATRPANAGMHYTILTSANALAIGLGGLAGGLVADRAGKTVAFALSAVACLLPGLLLPRWDVAARASRE